MGGTLILIPVDKNCHWMRQFSTISRIYLTENVLKCVLCVFLKTNVIYSGDGHPLGFSFTAGSEGQAAVQTHRLGSSLEDVQAESEVSAAEPLERLALAAARRPREANRSSEARPRPPLCSITSRQIQKRRGGREGRGGVFFRWAARLII